MAKKVEIDIVINTSGIKSASDELDKFKEKVNKTSGSDGKGGVSELGKAAENVGKKYKESFKDAADAIGGLGVATGGASNAIRAFGAVLKANPVMIIATIILGIVTALYELKDSVAIVGKVFDYFGNIVNGVVQSVKDFTDNIGLTTFAVEDKAKKTLIAAKKEQEAITERYNREIEYAKAAGKETIDLEKQKRDAIIATIKEQMKSIIVQQMISGRKATEEETKALEELKKQATDTYASYNLSVITHTTKVKEENTKKLEEDNKTKEEERLKGLKWYNDKMIEHQKFLDAMATLERQAKIKENAETEAADQREIDGIIAQKNARLQVQKDYNAAKVSVQQAEFNATENFIGALSGLVGKNKKLANAMLIVQKGMSIARIVIETTAAINANRAAALAVPAILPPGVPNPAAAAAMAISATKNTALRVGAAGSIATILATTIGQLATKSDSGGDSGGGTGGGGGGVPNTSLATQQPNSTFQAPGLILTGGRGSQQTPVVKAIVVSTDITKEQGTDKILERRSSY